MNPDTLAEILEEGGALEAVLDGFEPREAQTAFLRLVTEAFNKNSSAIVEAGTGMGKSLAYLLPALSWAALHEERVLVSTATIALQHQLMGKDIPLVLKLLGLSVKTALVKGRGNYLCLNRLEEAVREKDLLGDEESYLNRIRDWVAVTPTGSFDDIPFQSDEAQWSRMRCEADACSGSLCPHFGSCFLMRSRRKAAEASLLVVNHHLLFADLVARLEGGGPDETAVLPPYRRIVLDEAHHAEDSATSLFTATLSLPGLSRVLGRLWRRRGGGAGGLLVSLSEYFPAMAESLTGSLPKLLRRVRARAENLDALGRDLVVDRMRLAGEPDETEKIRFFKPMEELERALREGSERLADLLGEIPEEENKHPLVVEARQSCGRLKNAAALSDAFLHREEYGDQVFWLESQRRLDGGRWLACHMSPLSIAEILHEALWEPYETVIATSSTLAVAGNFHHWRGRVGAGRLDEEPLTGLFPSPFDFASRVLLGVPLDAPPPDETEKWKAFLVESVVRALDLAGGHALVLFTSYDTLKSTFAGVRETLGERAPRIFVQGEEDASRILRRFREDASSVLFATDSFWEGVDIPGESLKLVVITRLPFRPPTDPVSQARREALAAAGENPFMQLTLPEAVIRFRQGFGRLMRRTDDHGAVLVLDSRVLRKQYGPLFLDALPPAFRSVKNMDAILRDLEDFLFPVSGDKNASL